MPRVLNRRTHGIPAGAVYVGRPTKWGNPFKVGVHGGQGECARMFAEELDKAVAARPELKLEIQRELRGKDLVCWCSPNPCHADALLRIANEE